jgi:signal transduction histidine kinase
MTGRGSSTFAYLYGPGRDGLEFFQANDFDPPAGPSQGSLDRAWAGGHDVAELVIDGAPWRVLTDRREVGGRPYAVQVFQDRAAEQRALETLLAVLIGGGVLAFLGAILVGALYADRALVPIRRSLAERRAALQRQREFAADASHELRTPLTVVRASVEHLRRHADLPVREVGSALDDIDAEVTQLSALVDDLLLLARADSGAMDLSLQAVELGDLAFEAAAALAGPATARGVAVQVDPQPVMVQGDPVRLRQLVTILVDNAVRHSPAGGIVEVAVRRDREGAVLLVLDQGPGVPPVDLPRVFDRFWQGPGSSTGGAGLGLAIAAAIVTRHGGRIGVSNRPTGGAAFTVVLPQAAVAAGRAGA